MKMIQKLTAALLAGAMTVCPLSFAAFAEDATDAEENFLLGDANLDGKIDTFDAIIALQICVDQNLGLAPRDSKGELLSEQMISNAGVTKTHYITVDGYEVTVSSFDAQIILEYKVKQGAGLCAGMTIAEYAEISQS